MNSLPSKKLNFGSELLAWHREFNHRHLPWKGEKDPYRIWLAEIILQQTRAEQGMPYYLRFISRFPRISDLANARDEDVFKCWEGLGYYSRCRNLLTTARYIVNDLEGNWPQTYDDLLKLKGVGPYTAAAISSFAFREPRAVVDGNVYRLLARVFGIKLDISSTEGKKYFSGLAQSLLVKEDPAGYNQAIMDYGASVCTPNAPACGDCVFNPHCYAAKHGMANELPVKIRKPGSRKRWFYYLVVENDKEVLLRKRETRDIWQDLYEFILIEKPTESTPGDILPHAKEILGNKWKLISVSPHFQQVLSHQRIMACFIRVKTKKFLPNKNLSAVASSELGQYAFPRVIRKYVDEIFPAEL